MPLPDGFHALARAVSNRGRWGDGDERGTLNLIDDAKRLRAAACVRTGRAISLALPLQISGPQAGFIPGRVNPVRTMVALHRPLSKDPDGIHDSDDAVFMGLQAATHWDALAHVGYGGELYNGHPASAIGVHGASRCGIDRVGPLVSRGVLLDVAHAKGVERLEPGYAITPSDLDDAVRCVIEPGDVLLVRTGQVQLAKAGNVVAYAYPSPGPGMACARWFRDRDVAAVATDTLPFEVYPCEDEDVMFPLHMLHLVEMGMLQGQNFDLDELSEACAAAGSYDFLLSATPEPFVGGVGGPVAPVAVL